MKITAAKGAGGTKDLIPSPLNVRQRRRTALEWICDAADKRKERDRLAVRFADEIVAVVEGRSSAWEKRSQVYCLWGGSARVCSRLTRGTGAPTGDHGACKRVDAATEGEGEEHDEVPVQVGVYLHGRGACTCTAICSSWLVTRNPGSPVFRPRAVQDALTLYYSYSTCIRT